MFCIVSKILKLITLLLINYTEVVTEIMNALYQFLLVLISYVPVKIHDIFDYS